MFDDIQQLLGSLTVIYLVWLLLRFTLDYFVDCWHKKHDRYDRY